LKGFLETLLGEDWIKEKPKTSAHDSQPSSPHPPAAPPSTPSAPPPQQPTVGMKSDREVGSPVPEDKISPEVAEVAPEKLRITPDEAFFIGDSTGKGLADLLPGIKKQTFEGYRASRFVEKLSDKT